MGEISTFSMAKNSFRNRESIADKNITNLTDKLLSYLYGA